MILLGFAIQKMYPFGQKLLLMKPPEPFEGLPSFGGASPSFGGGLLCFGGVDICD